MCAIMIMMKETIGDIYKNNRKLFILMMALLVISVGLLVFSLLNLKVSSSTVHVGYSDIGSYQGGDFAENQGSSGYISGRWIDMLAFPVLAVVLGVFHNFVVIKLYKNRGEASARVFVLISLLVLVSAILVLWRLTQES